MNSYLNNPTNDINRGNSSSGLPFVIKNYITPDNFKSFALWHETK